MSQWRRIHEQATGALPVATLTKWGAALIALLLAAFLLTQSIFNSAPEEVEVRPPGDKNRQDPRASAGSSPHPGRRVATGGTTASGGARPPTTAGTRNYHPARHRVDVAGRHYRRRSDHAVRARPRRN